MGKKYRIVLIVFIMNLLLGACTRTGGDKTSSDKESVPKLAAGIDQVKGAGIKDYFPFKANTLYEYKGVGDEYAQQKTYMEYIEGDRAQMKIFNPGRTVLKILEYRDDSIIESYSELSGEYIENRLDSEDEEEIVVLKAPLQVGNSWKMANGRERKITAIDKLMDLPYGKLESLEVTTELGDGRQQLDYYSLNIGHVASIYKDGDFEVKTVLSKIHKGDVEEEIRFFYPLADGKGTIYKDRQLSFKTNDKIEKILEDKMKNPKNETLLALMSRRSKIRSIDLDRVNNILKIDFNENFLEDNIELGSFLEGERIQAIVNTLGAYYETNKVFISIEGRAYESGHIALEEGDYFETSDEDAIKIVE